MATNTTPLPQFANYITGDPTDEEAVSVQDWMHNTADAQTSTTQNRGQCTLNLTGLAEADLKKYFDRSALGELYASEYDKQTTAGKPFGFFQMESDLIYSMHKCFAARHRGRLMVYRDDCSQKKYHTYSALSLGLAKYDVIKNNAEQRLEDPTATTA